MNWLGSTLGGLCCSTMTSTGLCSTYGYLWSSKNSLLHEVILILPWCSPSSAGSNNKASSKARSASNSYGTLAASGVEKCKTSTCPQVVRNLIANLHIAEIAKWARKHVTSQNTQVLTINFPWLHQLVANDSIHNLASLLIPNFGCLNCPLKLIKLFLLMVSVMVSSSYHGC